MWTKTLVAAAVATVSLPAQAAEPAANTAPLPTPPPEGNPSGREATRLAPIQVEGGPDEEGLKAERQSTSSKLDLTLRETPQSVSVITQESLRDRQVTDFGQALEMSAGVSQSSGVGPFAGQAGFGFNETTIRGIAIDSLNDVRDDGFINSTYFAIADMAIYDRIEVIKGPNSVAYGRGSAGGLINRIRKKPLAESQTEVELTAGAFDSYRADVDVTGPMTSSGNVLGRVVAAYGDEGSFVDGVNSQRTVLAPSVDLTFAPGTRLLLEGLYQRENFIPNSGFPLLGEPGRRFRAPSVSRSLFFGVPNEKDNRWTIATGTAQLEQSLGDTWLATLRLNKNKTASPIKTDRYAYGLSETGDTLLSASEFSVDRDIWAGELKFSGDLDVAGAKVKVAAGMDFNDNDYHRSGAYAYIGYANIYARDFNAFPQPEELSPGFEYTTHDKTRGYYLQAQVRPIEKLSVLLGLRFDQAESEFASITGGTVDHKKDHDVTGRVGVTYDLTKQVSVYGVYAQSFLPTLTAGFGGKLLDPETGEIFEVGLKTEWFEGRFGVNTAAYRIDRENMPVSVPVPPGEEPYSISAGLQRSQGFEIEVNGKPLPGWNVSAAYNWLDSEFKDPNDIFFGAKVGGSARWQLGVFSTYEIQTGPLQGFGFGGSVFAIADRGLSTFERGTLDGYTRADLNLFYKGLPSYDFRLSVRNVLDERYIEGADRSNSIAQFGSPPAWLLSVSHRFGE